MVGAWHAHVRFFCARMRYKKNTHTRHVEKEEQKEEILCNDAVCVLTRNSASSGSRSASGLLSSARTAKILRHSRIRVLLMTKCVPSVPSVLTARLIRLRVTEFVSRLMHSPSSDMGERTDKMYTFPGSFSRRRKTFETCLHLVVHSRLQMQSVCGQKG